MNRKLLRSVREYKKESIFTPILVIFEVLMEVLIPLQMANIIDIGIENNDMGYILRTGAVLIVMALVSLFSAPWRERWERLLLPATPKICGMIFSIKYRIFHLRTLTIFQRPVW